MVGSQQRLDWKYYLVVGGFLRSVEDSEQLQAPEAMIAFRQPLNSVGLLPYKGTEDCPLLKHPPAIKEGWRRLCK